MKTEIRIHEPAMIETNLDSEDFDMVTAEQFFLLVLKHYEDLSFVNRVTITVHKTYGKDDVINFTPKGLDQ